LNKSDLRVFYFVTANFLNREICEPRERGFHNRQLSGLCLPFRQVRVSRGACRCCKFTLPFRFHSLTARIAPRIRNGKRNRQGQTAFELSRVSNISRFISTAGTSYYLMKASPSDSFLNQSNAVNLSIGIGNNSRSQRTT